MSHVVVVDDDRAIRQLLSFALELEAYEVTCLCDGRLVIETVERLSGPCVILLDLMMPYVDGWAVCHSLSERPELQYRCRVVLMTASVLDDHPLPPVVRSLLPKPFELGRVYPLLAVLMSEMTARAAEASSPPLVAHEVA